MQPRKTGYHGSPMKFAFYRDIHFRADSELLTKMSEFAGVSGLSFSEMMRQAIHKFIDEGFKLPEGQSDDRDELIRKIIGPDDPSNPLG